MSMRTTVSGSGRGSGQKSLEASSVPIAMTASASAVSSGSSSRKPMAPRLCSPSSSMTPLAFEDRMIPAPRVSRQRLDLLARPVGSGAGDDERSAAGGESLGGGIDPVGVRCRQRSGHRRVGPAGPGGLDEVEGDLDRCGAPAAGAHGRQRLSHGQGHLARAGDPVDLGEHGGQGAGLVADLVEEAVAAAGVGQRHAGADEEHGHGIGEGLEQGRERVEHGRSGGGDDDVDLTGHACRAVGHVAGPLFVPG
jgi:hypothetical protein